MLGETIAAMRKQKGMSQQALADRIFVVRQTISKWEKNLSVPDAEALTRLADALETTVEVLLGANPAQEDASPMPLDIAAALSRINDQLVIQNSRRARVWKIIGWSIAGAMALYLLLIVLSIGAFSTFAVDTETRETQVETMNLPGPAS